MNSQQEQNIFKVSIVVCLLFITYLWSTFLPGANRTNLGGFLILIIIPLGTLPAILGILQFLIWIKETPRIQTIASLIPMGCSAYLMIGQKLIYKFPEESIAFLVANFFAKVHVLFFLNLAALIFYLIPIIFKPKQA